jgi:hypothetical protein
LDFSEFSEDDFSEDEFSEDEFSEDVFSVEFDKMNGDNHYHYKETYYSKNEYLSETNTVKEIDSFYNEQTKSYHNTNDSVSILTERLFVLKLNNDFVFRTCFQGYVRKQLIKPIRSSVSFIYAEYRHPEMKTPIEIKIDKRYFLNGNELFTPLFLFRILQYQPLPFLFDDSYSVHLMDLNANVIILDNNHYIKIHMNDYDVMDLAYSDKNI